MSDAAYQHWHEWGGVIDLSSRTKLRLTGADRVRYLNGQVTANVTRLDDRAALPACVTTAKGKLSAEVFISSVRDLMGGAILVDSDEALQDLLPARLERYIVADDVAVENVTQSHALLHFLGPLDCSQGFAAGIIGAQEEAARQSQPWTLGERNVTLRAANRYGMPGWDVWLMGGTAGALRHHSASEAAGSHRSPSEAVLCFLESHGLQSVITDGLAEVVRIEAGIPRWGRELGEDTLPPEAGLDRTHIDYAKGCYIGQEVISRIKSVGHVNRQLTGFLSDSGESLEVGWPIFVPGALEKPIGEITSAAYSFALAKPVALGYVRRGSPTGGLLAGPAGRLPVTPAELPLVRHFSSP